MGILADPRLDSGMQRSSSPYNKSVAQSHSAVKAGAGGGIRPFRCYHYELRGSGILALAIMSRWPYNCRVAPLTSRRQR